MGREKIQTILENESRRFSRKLILPFVVLYVGLQFLIVFAETNRRKDVIQLWLEKNESRIGQALFLQNLLDIEGLIDELDEKSFEGKLLSIRISDQQGKEVIAPSEARTAKVSAPGFKTNYLTGTVAYSGDIKFSDQVQGRIQMTAQHDFATFFRLCAIAFLMCSAFFLLVRISLKNLNASIEKLLLKPLTDINSQISSKVTSLSGMTRLQVEEGQPREIEDFVNAYNRLVDQIRELGEREQMIAEARVMSSVASQVAHDIRSPLSALNMVTSLLHGLPEDQRLIIRSAVQRINDIANELLSKSKKKESPPKHQELRQSCMISGLVDSLVSEKRAQFRDRPEIEILPDIKRGYGLFADVDRTEIARVISNLINNAVEATRGRGHILVSLSGQEQEIIVTVQDNGIGMSNDLVARVGEKGFTHGKQGESGSGLGLYHAKQTLLAHGGRLEVESTAGLGTRVSLVLPRAASPSWFLDEIPLHAPSLLVSVDDDMSVHQIWADRLSNISGVQHKMFTTTSSFEEWFATRPRGQYLFLVDYEFIDESRTGLDLIEKNGLAGCSILVTSRYEDESVRERAAKLRLKIIPKGMAGFVQFRPPPRQFSAELQ